MPDTGAPWNIPYVESTDLVSDWPADSLALANAIDAGLDAAGNAGIGSNVVQTVKTDFYVLSSIIPTEITGLTATITPSSATSKILVIADLRLSNGLSAGATSITLTRNGTDVYIGTDGTLRNHTGWANDDNTSAVESITAVYLDSPATTSATTYAVDIAAVSGTAYLNRRGSTTNDGFASSITAIEVAA